MNIYTWRGHTFRAWSDGIQCDKVKVEEEHYPHAYDSEFFSYGPYMCWGVPSYRDEPPEQELTRSEALELMSQLWKGEAVIDDAASTWRMRAALRALRVTEPEIDRALPRPPVEDCHHGPPPRCQVCGDESVVTINDIGACREHIDEVFEDVATPLKEMLVAAQELLQEPQEDAR